MKKRLLFVALLCLLTMSVIGVGISSAQGKTYSVWVSSVFTDAQKAQLDRWSKTAGVTVDVESIADPFEQTVLARWAAGDRPDLLYFHAIGNWIVQLNPPETLVPLDGQPFIDKTVPGILEKSAYFQGHIYAAVLNYPYLDGVFYNKPVFEKYGLEIPHSYDDLVKLCETIKTKAPGVSAIFQAGGSQWPLQVLPFMMWNDDLVKNDLIAKLNKNEIKFTDPAFVAGVQKEKDLQDKGCYNSDILTATFEQQQKALIDGTTAMVFQGSWMVGSMIDSFGIDSLNKNVDFFGLSTNSNVVSWQTVGAGAVYIPKTDDATEKLGLDFINFATGDDYATYLKESHQFSILKGFDAPTDVPLVLQHANEQFLKDGAPQFQQTLVASYGAFETYLSAMVSGQSTAEEVMQNMANEYERSARAIGIPEFQ